MKEQRIDEILAAVEERRGAVVARAVSLDMPTLKELAELCKMAKEIA